MFEYYNLWYKYKILSSLLIFIYNYILNIPYYMQVWRLVEKMHLSNLSDEGTFFCNTLANQSLLNRRGFWWCYTMQIYIVIMRSLKSLNPWSLEKMRHAHSQSKNEGIGSCFRDFYYKYMLDISYCIGWTRLP
jgi:hypothetical protein